MSDFIDIYTGRQVEYLDKDGKVAATGKVVAITAAARTVGEGYTTFCGVFIALVVHADGTLDTFELNGRTRLVKS